MSEFASQPRAGLDTFRDVRDAYFNSRIDALQANGISLDVLQDPEVRNELRLGFAKFAFQGMGPGSEFNYDEPIIAEGLRRLGFSDIVSDEVQGPPLAGPTRAEQMEMLAQQVAAIREQQTEPTEQLQARIRGAGAREVFPRIPGSAMDEVPAAIGTAIQQIESFPLIGKNPAFDPRAKKDPRTFQQAAAFAIEGYDGPGAQTLMDNGVPRWLARAITYGVLDPTSWMDPKSLFGDLAKVAVVGGVSAVAARGTFKAGRALLGGGERITGDALVETAIKLTRPFDEAIAPRTFEPLLEVADVRGFAQFQEAPRARRAFEKFATMLETRRGGIAEGRVATDGRFIRLVKGLYDEGLESSASELLDLRVALANTPEEIANLQSLAARELGDKFDPKFLTRKDIKEVFFDVNTGDMVEVEAGLMGRYLRNPRDFTTVDGKWAGTPDGRAMQRLFNGKSAAEAAFDTHTLVPVGQTRAVREAAAGIEWAVRNAPSELVDHVGASQRLSFIRKIIAPSSAALQRTPVFKPLVWSANARAAFRGAWNLRLHDALGGEVHHLGDALTDIAFSNGAAVRLTHHSPLIPARRSLFSPGRLIDRAQRQVARDLNDQLTYVLGDQLHKDAIQIKRTQDGLKVINADTMDARVQPMAAQVRLLFDELGEMAKAAGIVDPQTLVKNYLPRIYKNMQGGMSLDDAINAVRRGDGPVALEAEPFFAMMRSGENPQDLMTDLPKMFERYVDTLSKHMYLKPVVNDILEVIGSAKSGMSVRDRFMALEFLHHQLGGVSRTQAKLASGMALANRNLEALAGDSRGLMKYFDELIDFGESTEGLAVWASRQMTDMLYTNFIGSKFGLGLRNLTQQALALPMIGGTTRGFDHWRRGTVRMMSDKALGAQYLERARLWNWHNEAFEFADEAFNSFGKQYPDLIPMRWKRLTMGWYQLTDMQNRMQTWGAGYDYAEDVIRKIQNGKKPNWGNSAAGFTVEERNGLRRMLEAGDYDNFKQQYADAVVNNSQWLYNRKNRPQWAQEHPILGTTLVFLTWPMNFGAVGWRHATGGAAVSKYAMFKPGEMARLLKRGSDYLLPMTLVAGAMEYGGRALGIGGMGDWLLPDLAEFPGGMQAKQDLGFETEDRALVPLPVKPLLAPMRMITGDEPLGGSLPVLRMWYEGAKAAREVTRSLWTDENTEQRALALQQFFKAFPVTQQGLQFATNLLAEAAGIEPDPEFRDGIFEQVLGAMLQLQESEGLGADFRRSQALPKKPGEQERFLLPVEGVR